MVTFLVLAKHLSRGESKNLKMPRYEPNDFERIRSDHRSEVAEDYLEAIAYFQEQEGECRGAALAKHFSVSHATVTQTVARLRENGLVDTEPYGPVKLTRKGHIVARKSRERHETVLAFLQAIGVSEPVAAADAEGIEHHISDETLKCLKRFVKRKSANE